MLSCWRHYIVVTYCLSLPIISLNKNISFAICTFLSICFYFWFFIDLYFFLIFFSFWHDKERKHHLLVLLQKFMRCQTMGYMLNASYRVHTPCGNDDPASFISFYFICNLMLRLRHHLVTIISQAFHILTWLGTRRRCRHADDVIKRSTAIVCLQASLHTRLFIS